ncbi:hypothetical protein QKC54_gp0797 [Megavirus baoshan]|uniref:Uncharacterized protein n=1 Tax=Megavirus baoshan TaxID=2496520 RepID=A0A3S8UYL4_9VIRU|nr:hypothetical protein QKC54_gp0797 [Megavirus baoshan]AZL89910.1 hypothetical protein Mb0275 [Megavirus baoshan]
MSKKNKSRLDIQTFDSKNISGNSIIIGGYDNGKTQLAINLIMNICETKNIEHIYLYYSYTSKHKKFYNHLKKNDIIGNKIICIESLPDLLSVGKKNDKNNDKNILLLDEILNRLLLSDIDELCRNGKLTIISTVTTINTEFYKYYQNCFIFKNIPVIKDIFRGFDKKFFSCESYDQFITIYNQTNNYYDFDVVVLSKNNSSILYTYSYNYLDILGNTERILKRNIRNLIKKNEQISNVDKKLTIEI